MEFLGIGNDIIEIKRIEKAVSKESFVKKVYTEKEIEAIRSKGNRAESYAGRFAAKGSCFKSFGNRSKKFSPHDIEILNNEIGKPYVFLEMI